MMFEYLNIELVGIYSTKVFLGGLPHDTKAYEIKDVFSVFGDIKNVEWPDSSNHPVYPPNGFAFVVYQNEKSVHHLLNYTKKDNITGALYVWFKSQTEFKPIEIRAWKCEDSTFIQKTFHFKKPKICCEVFIGGIPRSFSAVQLAGILEEHLKVNVFSVVIDVDTVHRYPKGTAKVAFSDSFDAWKAISVNKISLRIGNQLKHMEIKLFKKNVHAN
uniref:Cytoplasmic polyadenylation element-binding protein 4 (Trinotate prediction) n=1 Tax=Myxobolus squamalis TaxID=59785 RepID=A0A6B2FW11_MYXSQ